MSKNSKIPQITIITSTFNARNQLPITAESIRNQSLSNFEWIIADGGSKDGTVEWIEGNLELVNHWVSEKDNGIYDAWNKVLPSIHGDWVLFLGAGDELFSNETLALVSEHLECISNETEIAYGNVEFVSELKRTSVRIEVKPWDQIRGKWAMMCPMLPSHAGVFQRKSLLLKHGKFDDSFKIAGDTELLISSLQCRDFHYMDLMISKVVYGGVSFKVENHNIILQEHKRILHKYNLHAPFFHSLLTNLNIFIKALALKIFPKKISYAFFDAIRKLRGLEPKWKAN